MTEAYMSAESASLARAFAILVASLDASGVVDGSAIAASIRVSAREIPECAQTHETIAILIDNTMGRLASEGPARLSAVPKGPEED